MLVLVTTISSVALLRVCSSESDEAPPPVAVAGPVAAAGPTAVQVTVPPPAHGGTVVMAGAHPVEVVTHESGEVYAFVHGEAPPPGELDLSVDVPTRGGGSRPVHLRYHRGRSRWEGRVRNTVLVPGPVDVHVEVSGVAWHGHVATVVVAPAIVVEVEDHHHDIVIHTHGKHRKHRKHRGHGHVEVRIH
jgi:hypothetical protein